jgi:hypothetical protein
MYSEKINSYIQRHNLTEDQIAVTPEEVTEKTILYAGDIDDGSVTVLLGRTAPIVIGGRVDLERDKSVKSLGPSWVFLDEVNFSWSDTLKIIKPSTEFYGRADFFSCKGLREVSDGVIFHNSVDFSECEHLSQVSESAKFLGGAETYWCTELVNIPSSLRIAIQKHEASQHEIFVERVNTLHQEFLSSLGKPNGGTSLSSHQRSHRTTRCYSCKTNLDNEVDLECRNCGWIICAQCGACGCGYVEKIKSLHREFITSLGQTYNGANLPLHPKLHRVTHCYACTTNLDNKVDLECRNCGWIICAECGACGCGYDK